MEGLYAEIRGLDIALRFQEGSVDTGHQFNSVQFSPSVMSNSLQPHGLQHARLPCPSAVPGAYSNSCPSSW